MIRWKGTQCGMHSKINVENQLSERIERRSSCFKMKTVAAVFVGVVISSLRSTQHNSQIFHPKCIRNEFYCANHCRDCDDVNDSCSVLTQKCFCIYCIWCESSQLWHDVPFWQATKPLVDRNVNVKHDLVTGFGAVCSDYVIQLWKFRIFFTTLNTLRYIDCIVPLVSVSNRKLIDRCVDVGSREYICFYKQLPRVSETLSVCALALAMKHRRSTIEYSVAQIQQ